MHYCVDGSAIIPSYRRETLLDHVNEVVERIPSGSWQDCDGLLPLQRDTSPRTIVAECLPFCTGEPRTDAVYVLECLPNKNYRQTAARYLGRVQKRWNGKVEGADRLIYVGMTVSLLRRLDEHLNSPGNDGAHFTTVFPPVRVLDVSWYSSFHLALKAEELVARQLREKFPEDYVYQS